MTKILDSWAVLAWVRDEEPAASAVDALFKAHAARELDLTIHIINLGEVYYRLRRTAGTSAAETTHTKLSAVLTVVDATHEIVLEAARWKATHRISFADGFALATAARLRAPLVTGDPDFRSVHAPEIQIEWLTRSNPPQNPAIR
jgi:predicted nucleic acid-binding protein